MIGIDEVGRGCWAGPLLVVAVREKGVTPAGVKDSKQLTKTKRQELKKQIEQSCDIGEGWVLAAEIDEYGLAEAMRLGVNRALKSIDARPDEKIIMDGNTNYCSDIFMNVECVIKADSSYPIVSAASIYAKVTRDDFMTNLPLSYTVYEFGRHVGYGTARHLELIKAHGVSDLHRRSFKPIKVFLA